MLLAQVPPIPGMPEPVPSAVGNRNAAFTVFCASVIDPAQAEQVEAIRAAHERVQERLRPWSAGRVPSSFMGITDAAPERVRLAYQPRDYARLAELKTRFDPDNVFRINHNIPPNPAGSSA